MPPSEKPAWLANLGASLPRNTTRPAWTRRLTAEERREHRRELRKQRTRKRKERLKAYRKRRRIEKAQKAQQRAALAALKPPRHLETPEERLTRSLAANGTIPVSLRVYVRLPKGNLKKRGKAYYRPLIGQNRLWRLRSPSLVLQLLQKIDDLLRWLAEHGEWPHFH